MKPLLSFALLLVALLPLAACDSSEDGAANANSTVFVAYEGRLTNGTVFDSNPGVEFDLPDLIPGFRNGVVGMRVGETKTFEVPPELGYGNRALPGIPPNSTLIFEVTLLEIR